MNCEILLDRINNMPEQAMTPALARIREQLMRIHLHDGGKTAITNAMMVLDLINRSIKNFERGQLS